MTIDRYQPCPCGSGKKIKFCCGADLLPHLEKMQRMLEGDQRLACLEYVNQLLKKFPDRPALLTIKALLDNELGHADAAQETIDKLSELTPESPTALAERALLQVKQGDVHQAVDTMQQAIAAVTGNFPVRLHSVLGALGGALLDEGYYPAARAHFLLHASLGGDGDSRAVEILMQMNSSSQLPLLYKQDIHFAECDDAAPFKADFDTAMQWLRKACWRKAVTKFEETAQQHPDATSILRNIALLRGYLADEAGAAAAWRQYARLVDATSPDDATEAEAFAQLLDGDDGDETVKAINYVYPVTDMDRLMELLLGSKRIVRLPLDVSQLATDDSPPPKGVFSLLDREMPEPGAGLTLETVPLALGDMFVYGRETDRPARLEITFTATDTLDDKKQAISQFAGDLLQSPSEENEVGEYSAVEEAMSWNWRLPEGTPREQRLQLVERQRQHVLLEVWPQLKLGVLDSKTPLETCQDPQYRLPLRGAVLLLEMHGQQNLWKFDYNELRTKLNLPKLASIDPWKVDIEKVPLCRYHRLDAVKLGVERLADFFQYASMMNARAAVRHLGLEIVGRDQLDGKVSKIGVYASLARNAGDAQEAIEFLHKARELSVAQGESPAQWLLAELPMRIEQRNVEEIQRIINQLQARHIHEPRVAQSLLSILSQYGLVQDDGSPMSAANLEPGPAAEASPAGGIWTPGGDVPMSAPSPAPPDDAPEKKSGIWVPD